MSKKIFIDLVDDEGNDEKHIISNDNFQSTTKKPNDKDSWNETIEKQLENDEELARQLQQMENDEFHSFSQNSNSNSQKTVIFDDENNDKTKTFNSQNEKNKKQHLSSNIVVSDHDEDDFSVNVHDLFVKYNALYFKSSLSSVSVEWSKRMTLCAGLCVYKGKQSGPEIRLSEPLLKFRTKKDVKETLLHEMIHAYLFLHEKNKDHDDHGEKFQSHMRRINQETGLKISIYHNFRDEVDLYRTHIWQCQGSCAYILKRAMNRTPSEKDPWWEEHENRCGGKFLKISEPEKKEKEKKRKKEKEKETKGDGENSSKKQKKNETPKTSTTTSTSSKKITDFFVGSKSKMETNSSDAKLA